MDLEQKYLSLMSHPASAGAELRLCFEILSLAAAIDRDCAARLAPHQLSESKFVILTLLRDQHEGTAPHLLADLAGVTRATMTGLLGGMARDGLISRTHDPEDRRKIVIRLTPAGQNLADELAEEHLRWIASVAAGLTVAERQLLSALLGRVRNNLERGTRNEKGAG